MIEKKEMILGGVITSILGVLFHFLYEWTGNNPLVALFCATNESTWEHLKLLFFPFLFWLIFYLYKAKDPNPQYFSIGAVSSFIGMLSIVTIFYTYTGILGYSIDFINIAIFFVGVYLCFLVFYKLGNSGKIKSDKYGGIAFFIIFCILFFIFTFISPNLGIFISPV